MSVLSEEEAFLNTQLGDSVPDAIVYLKCHGSLIINTKIRLSSGRVDSYDLFSLDGFVDNILIFMLSGIGNCASDGDPMLSVFPTITPDRKFTDIFKFLDGKYKENHPERIQHYKDMNSALGSYSVQPLIQGQELTYSFINKYLLLGDRDPAFPDAYDDIFIIDNENNKIEVSYLYSVANSLAGKRGISYDVAVRLVEIALTVDIGFVGGYGVRIPGGFTDTRRIKYGRIQRLTLRELFYLLHLLGYKNPLILDSSCSGNLSLSSEKTERLGARSAAKMVGHFIDADSLLVTDAKENINFTPYDITIFDKKCHDTIEMVNYIKSQVTFHDSTALPGHDIIPCDDSKALSIIRITGTDKGNIDSFIQLYNGMGNNTDNFYFLLDVANIAPYDKSGQNIILSEYFRIVIAVNDIITKDGCSESLAIRVLGLNNKDINGNIDITMDVNHALAKGAMEVMNLVPGCPGSLAINTISRSLNKNIENLTEAIPESIGRARVLANAVLYVMNELPLTQDQVLTAIGKTKNRDGSPNADAAIQYLRSSKGGKRIKKTMRRNVQRSKRRNAQRYKKSIKRKNMPRLAYLRRPHP
jgi:hypothetical protein